MASRQLRTTGLQGGDASADRRRRFLIPCASSVTNTVSQRLDSRRHEIMDHLGRSQVRLTIRITCSGRGLPGASQLGNPDVKLSVPRCAVARTFVPFLVSCYQKTLRSPDAVRGASPLEMPLV